MVKTEKTEIRSVREALKHFCLSDDKSSHVPNYVGFSEWISAEIDRMKIESSIPLHAIPNNSPSISLQDDLIEEIEKAGIIMTPEGPKPRPGLFGIPRGGESKLRAFNRAKLLINFLSNISDRWRETLLALQQMMQGNLLSEKIRSSSPQAQQRVGFFNAITKKDINLAFKMLGRLREEDHDPGELEYLEAVANFYANELDKAIEYASSVQSGSADWLRASFIKIEALAIQGKTEDFLEVLNSNDDLQIPINYMRYLLQLLIRNAPDPPGSLESIGKSLGNRAISDPSDLRAYGLFNRYSCNLAVQWVEYRRDMVLRQCAVEQSNAAESTDQGGEDLPLAMIQIQAALCMDQSLINEIESTEIDVAYQAIVRRLLNGPQPEPHDLIQALQVQWRIGDREVFLNNIMQNLDHIDGIKYREFQQIL
jgi:hypothetical protein